MSKDEQALREMAQQIVAEAKTHPENESVMVDLCRSYLEKDREITRLRSYAGYAFHAVRASLSYRRERNAARAEITLQKMLPAEEWRPLMGEAVAGYELEQEVNEHLAGLDDEPSL